MNQGEVLRTIVARLGETQPAVIGPEFSLEIPTLKGSLKRAALAAAIRRELGVNCRSAHSVRTFAELLAAVSGQPAEINGSNGSHALNGRDNSNSTPAVPPAQPPVSTSETSRKVTTGVPAQTSTAVAAGPGFRCGVDIESIGSLPVTSDYREHEFYRENFSPGEIAYCILQENPRMHFAARWCAKEALYKSDPQIRPAKLSDIEVVHGQGGDIALYQQREGRRQKLGHSLSISHTNEIAVAMVIHGNAMTIPAAPDAVTVTPAVSPSSDLVPHGSILPLVSAIAWFIAVGLSVWALVRTAQ